MKDKGFEKYRKKAFATGMEAAKASAKFVYDHREEISGAIIGAGKGAVKIGKNIYGYTYTKEDLRQRLEELNRQSEEYYRLSQEYNKQAARRKYDKGFILDGLAMSSAAAYAWFDNGTVPDDISKAYELVYPHVAEKLNLEQLAEQIPPDELAGYVNGIKGKLFELRYEDYLNEHLPIGYTASLASSLSNPGWDIQITDAFGNSVDVMQLKATESMYYVKSALERYPDIDVVTTEEVYNQLALNGLADNVVNSNISNDELVNAIYDALNEGGSEFDFIPSVIPFLVIGYSVHKKKHLSSYAKGVEFGQRSASSYLAYLVGGAVTGLSGMWALGVAAVFSANIGLGIGGQRYDQMQKLKDSIKFNKRIINRLKRKLEYV